MVSATVRRAALVAAMVLLAPLGWLSESVQGPMERSEAVVARVVPPATPQGPAIRRQNNPGSWLFAFRSALGRGLLAVAVVTALALLHLAVWGRFTALPPAASSLVRRRHAISLRAPPVTSCA